MMHAAADRASKVARHLVLIRVLCVLAAMQFIVAEPHGLTIAQLQRLLKIHAPDDLVAREIETRGLAFTPDTHTIQAIENDGAGTATLNALKERIPRGNIEIQAPVGSHVTVDSSNVGTVGQEGHIVLAGIPAGDHTIQVQQAGYTPKTIQITLAAKETKNLPVSLDWAGGYLTVKVSQPGAAITVAGIGTYTDHINRLPLPQGRYQVTATLTGMTPESRSLNIAASHESTLAISMSPDPQYVLNGILAANRQLDAGDVRGAIQLAQKLLKFASSNGDVEALLAEAYFQSNDDFASERHAAISLSEGGTLVFKVFHQHLSLQGIALHPAILTLTSRTLGYQPLSFECKYQSFSASLDQIHQVRAINPLGPVGSSTTLLELQVRDPQRPSNRRPVRLVFAMPGSQVMKQGGRMDYISSPPSCWDQVRTMLKIFQEAAQQNRN
jgi:hypothetical protein